MCQNEIVARVYRGEGVESIHYGSIVVVNNKMEITHYVGDPEFFTQARSEAKPFQALPLITSGAADHYKFSEKQIAITCGSHTGTDEHVEVVKANLAAAGNNESHLQCGVHPPLHYLTFDIRPSKDEVFSPLQHNCSGKHSGFLALARYIDDDVKEYLNPASKVQQMVLGAVSELYSYPKDKIKIGIDGCSAPVFGMPIKQAAIAYMRLANEISDDPKMKEAIRRVKQAMTDHPEMVSGEGRFDLALARTFPGRVFNKVGAEAVEGFGFNDPKIGIAVKILDGNPRALYPVIMEVLKQLGLLEGADLKHLQKYINPEITNFRKLVVGRIVAEFELKKA